MANTRETEGPSPATFEAHRTFPTPGRNPLPLAFNAVDCAAKRQVFVSFRVGADQNRSIRVFWNPDCLEQSGSRNFEEHGPSTLVVVIEVGDHLPIEDQI